MSIIEFDFNPEGIFALLMFAGLASAAFIIWMLVDAAVRPESDFRSGTKIAWLVGLGLGLLFSLVGFVVAIAYYVAVRRPAKRSRYAYAGGSPAPGTPSPPPVPSPTQQLTHCRNCGAKLVAGARFCHSCGASTQPEGS